MMNEIYTHFHPDERPFVDKAWKWIEGAARQHAVKRTDFLDPRQAHILSTLANREQDIQVRFYGGYEGAERQRALIAPDYLDMDAEDMGITVLEITSDDAKVASLQHGDYLGSILGLGIKREKIGDIQVLNNGCHCLAASEIAEFLDIHLQQVHRIQVLTQILPLNQLETAEQSLEEIAFTVASMRLDGIASDVYRLSRAKVLPPIKAGRCKVNWKVEEDPSTTLKTGDIVSLQSFGRFKVLDVEGVTKKGRIRVKVGKFV
jgi:RNA-binding protein YlmH